MFKILIGECKQEVSSFNPLLSTYADFAISTGEAILAFHRGGQVELGGALQVFDQRPDVQLLPTYSARAITSGGSWPSPAACANRLASASTSSIRSRSGGTISSTTAMR